MGKNTGGGLNSQNVNDFKLGRKNNKPLKPWKTRHQNIDDQINVWKEKQQTAEILENATPKRDDSKEKARHNQIHCLLLPNFAIPKPVRLTLTHVWELPFYQSI